MKNNQIKTDYTMFLKSNKVKFYSLNANIASTSEHFLPEILVITSFPPRECGIANYSKDLVKSLENKFKKSFKVNICALENERFIYNDQVNYILKTNDTNSYKKLAIDINSNSKIQFILLQHEFGFFKNNENDLICLLENIKKPKIIVFHTVLPNPNNLDLFNIQSLINKVDSVIVMTNSSNELLINDYNISKDKINIIAHGTHLVANTSKDKLKKKYNLQGKKVLSTFGLLNSGKNIETTLSALPSIIKNDSDVIFLIIGKTHPTVLQNEGEKYRDTLIAQIKKLQLQNHIRFINKYLPLSELLEFLQLTDIYLFTSNDPNQAVSGTFSYALSCGCPIISTPIPHAKEVLKKGTGILIDFENPEQLSKQVIYLLENEQQRLNFSLNSLHQMAPNSWENAAISHAKIFEKIGSLNLKYETPEINLNHIKKLTTDFGIIQFSIINHPDINSGYTLDDNARALVALCKNYLLSKNESDLKYITIYFNFIKYCLQPEGYFLNYVDQYKKFTHQNHNTNIADSNGRAIWALGYLVLIGDNLPSKIVNEAEEMIKNSFSTINKIYSTRAMAFVIKGLYYSNQKNKDEAISNIIIELANRLVQMYKHEATIKWQWYESYLTYANSILPEAMLCAYLSSGEQKFKLIAKITFDFLLSKIFKKGLIKVISNNGWASIDNEPNKNIKGGEQPIDVAYTILALSKFYQVFNDDQYLEKMNIAFSWFLGNNHLNQIIYNPCTGGCYDGLEDCYINLNQGAESTLSYLMARLVMETHFKKTNISFGTSNKLKKLENIN